MGVFRLYAEIADYLWAQPDSLTEQSLDEIAAVYSPYAYIGNRHSLQQAVIRDAERLRGCPNTPATQETDGLAAWWFGRRRWQTDSGAFPDFVLAWEDTGVLGDGALLELKDSRGASIASFNSTLPTARKSLGNLTPLVIGSVLRYESCFSKGNDWRDCFYLVRTHKQNSSLCRLSLVQGTFFETLPTADLLSEVWGQLLTQANIPAELQRQVIEYLAQLERTDIAQTRQIPNASIKPRLRIMSEIQADGNPHTYEEIPPRSINLIVKPPDEVVESHQAALEWLRAQLQREGVPAAATPQGVNIGASSIPAEVKMIHHRRNGKHLVIQVIV